MSLTQTQLIKLYEKSIGVDFGDVLNDSEALDEFILYENKAIDDYLLLWASAAGTWQGDDMNHTSYPIITRNIVAGQRDYDFTSDPSNRIIDVSKVLILDSATATDYREITPIDETRDFQSEILINSNQGTPYQYGKLSNAIFLDPIPSYSVNNGIKMIVNREGSYFTSTDTTKVAGVPAFHEYFYLKPALEKARIKGLSNLNELEKAVLALEGDERLRVNGKIKNFFSQRERDVVKRLMPEEINSI